MISGFRVGTRLPPSGSEVTSTCLTPQPALSWQWRLRSPVANCQLREGRLSRECACDRGECTGGSDVPDRLPRSACTSGALEVAAV